MIRSRKGLLADENGNSVIEATVVTTIVIFMIFILMIMGFLFYQEALVQTVANEAATSIARTYSYERKDPVTGYIGVDELADQGWSGSLYWLSDLSGKKAKEETEAKNVAKKLMDKRRLMACQTYECEVEIGKSDVTWFQDEITVTITETYSVPFVRLLGVSSDKSVITRKSMGRALCYDVIGAKSYYNTLSVLSKNIGDQAMIKMVKNIVKIATTSVDAVTNVIKMFFEN